MLTKALKYGLKSLPYLIKNRQLYPYYASFKLTDRCKYRCPFCNVWKDPAPELDTAGVKKVLKNLSECSLYMVSLEGGEPLLREDIGDILKYTEKMSYFILFTTSQRNILEYPWKEYSKYIDFLHISIDEGHNNLFLFDFLENLKKYQSAITVQTVVAEGEIGLLRKKVEKCKKVGVKILIMPAIILDGAKNVFPDWNEFKREVLKLKNEFPNTITTPRGYFDNVEAKRCSSSSIIINCDGSLYYPCRTLDQKPVNLIGISLKEYLESRSAIQARQIMDECERNCGWYQYFAIDVFTSPTSLFDGIRPYLPIIFNRKNSK